MKSRARNVIVGLTVLAALIVLAVGIYRFGSAPAAFFKPPQIAVTFTSERGDGLGDGSNINYLGVEAGRVNSVRRDPATNKIIIEANLYKDPPLPANLVANIVFMSPLGGVSSLDLRTDGPAQGQLANGAHLEARYLGSTFIPPEFAEAARKIGGTVDELNKTVKTFNDSKILDDLQKTIQNTNTRITQVGTVIDSVQQLVGDPKLREQVETSLASIQKASANAADITDRVKTFSERLNSTGEKIDETIGSAKTTIDAANQQVLKLSQSMTDRLQQMSGLLDNLSAITTKINEGKGTAGQLLNDPKLYQGLVDTTTKLNLTLDDIKRYVNQVEQEGFYLRLNK